MLLLKLTVGFDIVPEARAHHIPAVANEMFSFRISFHVPVIVAVPPLLWPEQTITMSSVVCAGNVSDMSPDVAVVKADDVMNVGAAN